MSGKVGATLPNASGSKPVPKIHHSPILRIPQNPYSQFALCYDELQNPDPTGSGLGTEAIVEAAGPDCVVPRRVTPIKLLGLKVLAVGRVGKRELRWLGVMNQRHYGTYWTRTQVNWEVHGFSS